MRPGEGIKSQKAGEISVKILITGFEAFGGEKINPSIETVKRLPDVIAGAEMIRL